MIKYFQKLKAKKGFTLVELIVVIAIIGVLAAILIPTMLNYVTSSRVTSADTTASEIKKTIDNFLTEADTLGYGMLHSSSATAKISAAVSSTGAWTLTITSGATTLAGEGGTTSTSAFNNKTDIGEWDGSGTIANNADRAAAGADADAQLAWKLKDSFPDVKSVCFGAFLKGGKTVFVAYTADKDDWANVASGDKPSVSSTDGSDDLTKGTFVWDSSTAGITPSGLIMGTSPKLALKVS